VASASRAPPRFSVASATGLSLVRSDRLFQQAVQSRRKLQNDWGFSPWGSVSFQLRRCRFVSYPSSSTLPCIVSEIRESRRSAKMESKGKSTPGLARLILLDRSLQSGRAAGALAVQIWSCRFSRSSGRGVPRDDRGARPLVGHADRCGEVSLLSVARHRARRNSSGDFAPNLSHGRSGGIAGCAWT